MTKRKVLAVGVPTITAVACAVWLVILYLRQPDFTEEQFEQLKEGMTGDEVVAIMKVAEGDYTFGFGDYRQIAGWQTIDGTGVPSELENTWCGRQGMIQVGFDRDGRLAWKDYWHAWPPRPEIEQRMNDAWNARPRPRE
jgi:hypothetical protein